MKKISLLFTLLLAVCSVTACGDNNDSSEEGNSASDSSSRIIKDDDDEDDEKSDDKEDEKSDDKDEEKSGSFTRGKVEDNVYSNEFSGLTFEIPDGWTILSDEEISDTMSAGLEAGGSSMDADTILNTTTYDCIASDMSTGESFAFIFEDVSRYSGGMTIDDYINAAKLATSYSMPDMNIDWHVDGEKDTLCGVEFDVFSMEVELENYGVSVNQDYYVTEKDGYMVVITYSSGLSSGSFDDYLDCFKD